MYSDVSLICLCRHHKSLSSDLHEFYPCSFPQAWCSVCLQCVYSSACPSMAQLRKEITWHEKLIGKSSNTVPFNSILYHIFRIQVFCVNHSLCCKFPFCCCLLLKTNIETSLYFCYSLPGPAFSVWDHLLCACFCLLMLTFLFIYLSLTVFSSLFRDIVYAWCPFWLVLFPYSLPSTPKPDLCMQQPVSPA